LSRRIRSLEDAIGLSLFERNPTGVRLTAGGRRFTASARNLLNDFDLAIDEAHKHGTAVHGNLRVGLIASLSRGVLRDLFIAFFEECPGIEVSIEELDRTELLTLLTHREIDIVIAAGQPKPELGDGILLHRERIYLAVSEDHPFADRNSIAWEDARYASFIVSAHEPGPEIHDYIVRNAADLGESVFVRRFRLGREGIMNLVGLGFGVSLVADHWRGVTYPNVTFVPVGAENDTVPFSITWRPENDNPALRRFISLARIEATRNGVLS
jgi:DNA-binding transcriptional LysR family regulator